MVFFVRAVVTGFGLSLGAALFKKHVAPKLGLDEEPKKPEIDPTLAHDGATDPQL